MIKECLPKVGIKLFKIPHARILFLVSLLFVVQWSLDYLDLDYPNP